ncbi:MAG: DMT family transporter [Pararhodobacter sp.]|nr:DMT family transporter [Pararhodobacter sp.]
MIPGEAHAIASAALYGLAGVAIAAGRGRARGDNGVFLSILVTTGMTSLLWLGWGRGWPTGEGAMRGLALFALAGVASTILGRVALYRATERIGAVGASLFRRLIPVFSLPVAFGLLGEIPDAAVLLGGGLILAGVLFYSGLPKDLGATSGLLLGAGSAFFYALAYSLRRLGMDTVPDPALGALVGAAVGVVAMPALAVMRPRRGRALRALIVDRSAWHWLAAVSLGAGQTLQFFALQGTTVSRVAVLGALDLVFSAALAGLVLRSERLNWHRFGVSGGLALLGTVIVFW